MSLPNSASLKTYGGAKRDYSPPRDSTTDRSASGVNPAYGDLAGCTHTIDRVWAQITLSHTGGAPTLVAHDEVWNNGNNSAPTVARSAAGIFTVTYPTTVQDEIPSGSLGYIGPVAVNLRGGRGNARGGATWAAVNVVPTSANILTVYLHVVSAGSITNTDPAADMTIDVWGL